MDMLYPPQAVSHHISLQLKLQRETHVITLALVSCPRERGSGEGRRLGEERERRSNGGGGGSLVQDGEGERENSLQSLGYCGCVVCPCEQCMSAD